MRVLVTGAAGQLGQELCTLLATEQHEVVAVDLDCDIASASAVRSMLRETRPDVLVNCAAYTRVDEAETHGDDAYRVNALGARVLAAECSDAYVRLCHVSTDYVFDGEKDGPYHEWEAPHPVNVYGASKLAGELEVQRLCPDHLIVRTSWLFGAQGPNFVLTMLRRAAEGRELAVVADQYGSPTWTGHLAPALLRLLAAEMRGVVHVAGTGETSWHGFAEAVMQSAGLSVAVRPLRTEEYPTAARRPRQTVLDCRVLGLIGHPPLPPWREGVDEYLRQRSASLSTDARR
ncbi:MAG: dTDP-4-dehydrorhamnose reductase [Candidatus Dormibacteria bacterium]